MVHEALALELSDLLSADLWGAEPTFEPFASCSATKPCGLSNWHKQVIFGLCMEVLEHQAL